MSNPFSRVIYALSYMCGPNIDAWVNAQETALEAKTTHTANPIVETNKVLWNKFETVFKAVWKDTMHTQSAYKQLMKLEMKNGNIDTYIATFERLADAAKWEANAKGTIACFKVSLQDHIHRRILFRETWPTDMNGWKEAARKETERFREIQNAGLAPRNRNNPQRPNRNNQQYQSTNAPRNTPRNDGVVPMDVDATSTSRTPAPPLKKLTDEERKKLSAEGRCFRCCQQGHMARFCPTRDAQGNTTPRLNAAVGTTDTNPAKSEPDKTESLRPPLSKAQQITAIEKSMTEEERGADFDERDMGEENV